MCSLNAASVFLHSYITQALWYLMHGLAVRKRVKYTGIFLYILLTVHPNINL